MAYSAKEYFSTKKTYSSEPCQYEKYQLWKRAVGPSSGKSRQIRDQVHKQQEIPENLESNCNRHADNDNLQKQVQVAERRLNFKIVSLQQTSLKFTYKQRCKNTTQRLRRLLYTSLRKCQKAQRHICTLKHSLELEDIKNLR